MSQDEIVLALAEELNKRVTRQALNAARAALKAGWGSLSIKGTVGGASAIHYTVEFGVNPNYGESLSPLAHLGGPKTHPHQLMITTPLAGELETLFRTRASANFLDKLGFFVLRRYDPSTNSLRLFV